MNDIPEIPELSDEINKKLRSCTIEIANIMDKYFPEVRESWDKTHSGELNGRVFMTIYLELIHAGFFKKD